MCVFVQAEQWAWDVSMPFLGQAAAALSLDIRGIFGVGNRGRWCRSRRGREGAMRGPGELSDSGVVMYMALNYPRHSATP